jgi:hypothetical protein
MLTACGLTPQVKLQACPAPATSEPLYEFLLGTIHQLSLPVSFNAHVMCRIVEALSFRCFRQIPLPGIHNTAFPDIWKVVRLLHPAR